ncbi:MAG: hypothetical protein L0Y54_14380 [Sporichthyaceae bacterium]|nr:hypothetical protein [Sporichthyaceae bacterium]
MEVHGLISALIVGTIVGVLGQLAVPGKQTIKPWMTVGIGLIAALIGAALGKAFDWSWLPTALLQVALAALGVMLLAGMGRGATGTGTGTGRGSPRI